MNDKRDVEQPYDEISCLEDPMHLRNGEKYFLVDMYEEYVREYTDKDDLVERIRSMAEEGSRMNRVRLFVGRSVDINFGFHLGDDLTGYKFDHR